MVNFNFKAVYLIVMICSALACSSCGQSGPLYLPADPPGKSQQGD